MTTTIKFTEAVEMTKRAAESDYVPVPTINEAGKTAVAEFVAANAKHPERNILNAWYQEAEQQACDLLVGYDASLEMRGIMTSTGNPVTLRLTPEMFDYTFEE